MRYHLIGICGTAMGSLAGMLQAKGHTVTGSDQNVYPPMSTQLEALGIKLMQGYAAEHLGGARMTGAGDGKSHRIQAAPDCVVVGNAISRGNAELEATLNRRLNYRSQAEVVKEEFIRGRRSLVVAGTHGKTTTTSLAAWVMEVGRLDPSFLVGGIVQNFGASFRVTNSDYFIIEGDEYDTAYFDKKPKFMHYLPEIAIVNNIEFDHADIYNSLDEIKYQFSRLLNLVPSQGCLIAGTDSAEVRSVLETMAGKLYTRLETFGMDGDAKWQARDVRYENDLTHFAVYREGAKWGEFVTSLIGEFNLRNCLAVIIAADFWGVSQDKIREALLSFKSVKRRAEVRGAAAGVTVIDDFAHHPTAVRETLRALQQRYAGRRIIAVFEPRSWSSRLATFQQLYVEAFQYCDYAVIAGVFDPNRKATHLVAQLELLDTAQLCEQITAVGTPAVNLPNADTIVAHLAPQLLSSDVVAVMSNGGFDGIHDKLLNALQTKADAASETANI